ncbi:protein NETWORKED 4A-like [Vigna umbellata]|uniref:protein NETWORKED 4A-like n=1 Tax=Vigna umbellata TaxID=87088 RepID=UPI001F5F6327|nr:protein NETWORKED 4A-like [Vigna umbellata]
MIMKNMTKRSLTTEMERNVRQMQKLIEDSGDSFAQKAEMYYKKRPELISLVEEFYRGYKSLVERYDYSSTPYDLQSQASGVSDCGSEPPSSMPSPSPRKMGRRLSPNRAAGFDVFLGSGGNVNGFDACQKDGDGSSTLTESDEDYYDDSSSMNSFSGFFGNGNDQNGMSRRVMELEIEIPSEGKEKLLNEEERVKNAEDFRARINAYEQELRNVNEKLRLSEGEISMLKNELEIYRSKENLKGDVGLSSSVEGVRMGEESLELKKLGEELRMTNEKLESAEMQIVSLKFGATKTFETIQQLQEQLEVAEKDVASWKMKFNAQKRENSRLLERHAKMRTNVADRDHEVGDLKALLSDVQQKMFFERSSLKSEITKLLGEKTLLEQKMKEWECQCQCLEAEIKRIQSEKIEMGERLKGNIESGECLKLERDNLSAEVGSLKKVIESRDNEIEEAHKEVEELRSRGKIQEEEIERQRVEILGGAEEKREAIRQLCFSLEHYRNKYDILRQAFRGNKRLLVSAT